MMRVRTFSVTLIFLLCLFGPIPGLAQDDLDDGLDAAKDLYTAAQGASGDERFRMFQEVQQLLDRIVGLSPQSDLALNILFQRPIKGIDVALVSAEVRGALSKRNAVQAAARSAIIVPDNEAAPGSVERAEIPELAAAGAVMLGEDIDAPGNQEMAALGSPDASPRQTAPPQEQDIPSAVFPEATTQTEARLNLDRAAIREIQSRLTAIGLDPRGIDGVIGPGTRGALRAWQQANDMPVSGYLDARQLESLRESSQQQLAVWLRDPGNQRQFSPPAPVAITPARLAGTWNFRARCGPSSRFPNSTVTGALTVRHAGGNNYTGTARNSQGLNGRFSARLDGRVLHSEINWGLLFGRVQSSGRISDDARSLSGRDSHGCNIHGSKR